MNRVATVAERSYSLGTPSQQCRVVGSSPSANEDAPGRGTNAYGTLLKKHCTLEAIYSKIRFTRKRNIG
ncbi:hypothetical protein TNCV_2939141 [Trichonephila clavipes]|nr:hypothetical protein TNCV_2939141 [Trichonephila clavipes]